MRRAEHERAATGQVTSNRFGTAWKYVPVALVVLFGLSACADADSDATGGNESAETAEQEGEGPVKVGSILDATGPLSLYGDPMVKATRLAVDTLNANGGVLGRQLELVAIDTQSDIAQYTAGAKTLADDPEIAVVHGGITSASREAIRPVFNQAEKLYFYNQLYEGGVCDKYTFATGIVPTQQMEVLLPYLIENYGPRIYTVAADYNNGRISAEWVREYAEELGAEVVGEEFFPLDVSDFGASLQKIQAESPDVVLSLLVGNDHLAFYRGFSAAGMDEEIQIASTVFGLGNEQLVLDPADAEGLLVAMPYFEEIDSPENTEFVEMFREAYPDTEYVNDEVNTVWIGWNMWAEAVEEAGTFDADAVIAVLEEGMTFNGPEGEVRMIGPAHHITHNVRLAVVNDSKGYDILETSEGIEPEFEMEQCDLVAEPDQSTQYEPE